jgi:acyl-CoA thioesterase I
MMATITQPARDSLTLICSGLTRASLSGAAGLERSPVGPRVKREDVNKRVTQTSRRRGYCWLAGMLMTLALLLSVPAAAADTVRIVALGDSLTAGYGLEAQDSFPAVLEAELRARGHEVEVVNAGVSGDTTRGGLERLDWAVADDTDAVIVELGANDALRGIEPGATKANLDTILGQLVERDLPVLLAGMQAPPNLGDDYAAAFNAIFPDLAERHGVLLYPFFLEGVAAERQLNQPDGMHPNEAGVREIVARMIEPVEALIAQARGEPAGTTGER